jgi:uncharacterized membrane protein
MSILDRFFRFLLHALGLLFVAGIVHIASILLMPYVAPHDAFARLAPLGRIGQLVLLPQAEPGHQLAPFADPAVSQGLCLYDLDQGSLLVHGDLDPGGLVTLSFRSKSGNIYYAMTDRASQHGAIAIRVLTAAQRDDLEDDEDDQSDPDAVQELRLVAPERTGVVLISAFVPFPSARAQSIAQIKSIACSQEPLEQE